MMQESHLVKDLIRSYFEIVKKSLCDLVPKSIMHFLVNACCEALHRELVTRLYKEHLFLNLLQEKSDLPRERRRAAARLRILEEASIALNDFMEPKL